MMIRCSKFVRRRVVLALAGVVALGGAPAPAAAQDNPQLVKDVIAQLNRHQSVAGTESAKFYKVLFDAYLQLTRPPMEVGPGFNLDTIWPGMADWQKVSGWAESNPRMAEAILNCKDSRYAKVGLPYGKEGLDPGYIRAGVFADVGVDGSLRNNQFEYVKAMDTIAAFATAEIYRLMEGGQSQQALDLSVAMAFVVRQFCDREFLAEKMHFVNMLSSVMKNMRDVLYNYQDKLSASQCTQIALQELPFLRPDRSRLFMPEADRIVAEALITEVFDERSEQPNPDKFASTFAEVQSRDAPLTLFGAAKRWAMIAAIHSPLTDSRDRLKLVYDDWWRRWRIDEYDEQLLSVPTQFERINPIRYAAVIYSLENLTRVFAVRNTLVAEINGTIMAAALCAYKGTYNTYPDDAEKLYGQSMRRRNNSDPYDKQLRPFRYQLLTSRRAVSVAGDTVWIESGEALAYSLGQDHEDNRAATHSDDGAIGDLVLWPPMKTLQRKAGLLQ